MTLATEAAPLHKEVQSKKSQSFSLRSYLIDLIEHFCLREDLSTYDPYDIWTTAAGLRVKQNYNQSPKLGLAPAAAVALLDTVFNAPLRSLYRPREYAIVRSLAVLSLLNFYRVRSSHELLLSAKHHLQWLAANQCSGYSGPCWGLGFPHAVSRGLVHDANTPFSTITPYALEAFTAFHHVSPDPAHHDAFAGILRFLDCDIQIMEEDQEVLATSYGPLRDRIVTNAVSYTMFAYATLLPHTQSPSTHYIQKIQKLYAYLCRHQRPDGSWLYSPHGKSFIDCFHSCIVLKNIVKTDRLIPLPDANAVLQAGYHYLKSAFLDQKYFLFRRFSVRNKPGIVRFDLYDNAEGLQLALLLGDKPFARKLAASIVHHFCEGRTIYSEIDFLGMKHRQNTLRWAVMPFLYAASILISGDSE